MAERVGARPEFVSIQRALGGTDNALGFIRLVLAAAVVFDHTFPLGGWGHDPVLDLTQGQANLGGIAVAGFFAISGYLIAKSGQGTDVLQFLWRRLLRIFPAFWVVLLATAFILGPILWLSLGRPLGDYFTTGPSGPFYYFTSNWTLELGTWGIHDLLVSTPYGQEVGGSVFNGSLWTLWYEWRCYLLIAVFVLFAVLARARVLVVATAALFFVFQIMQEAVPGAMAVVVPWLGDQWMVTLGLPFLVGASIAVYSSRVPYDNWLGALSLAIFAISLPFGGFKSVGTVAGVYGVLWLGARLPRGLRRIGARNDYSYGIYIYGFVVTQTLAFAGVNHYGWFVFFLSAMVITFVFGWLSWHGVEKHALRLKSWGPGRGVRYWWSRGAMVMSRRRPPEDHSGDPAP